MSRPIYSSKYNQSKALIIGIDNYPHVKKLDNAASDARALKKKLVEDFSFEDNNICLLIDQEATKEKIESKFMAFSDDSTDQEDRLLFFFAGHGHVLSGRRGNTGFLVPFEADISKRSTLIRWDYFTRSSSLIPAKHMLFIIDACYGGTALSRDVNQGSHRLLGDMIGRLSYQILTSGKADETVSDGNGPRKGHSLFMGHLLAGLDGAATLANSQVITAQSLMFYMYNRVGSDVFSEQTPHYGYLDGEGDFVFNPTIEDEDHALPQEVGGQQFVQYPIVPNKSTNRASLSLKELKRLIGDHANRIELEGHIDQLLRSYRLETESDELDPGIEPNEELINSRVSHYHEIMKPLVTAGVLLSKWADTDHQFYLLQKIIKRIADPVINPIPGYSMWTALRWYPLTMFYYTTGISALSVNNYTSLRAILETKIPVFNYSDREELAFIQLLGEMNSIGDAIFKRLPDRKRQFVPMSELLFDQFQSLLDKLLFLGGDYEKFFDLFEVLTSFYYAYETKQPDDDIWVFPGRYAYKHNGHISKFNPLDNFIEEVGKKDEDWIGFKSKLFPGTTTTFNRYAAKIKADIARRPIY